jgi:effector-binding domain-containing protein
MTLYSDTEYRERDIHVGACLAFEGTLEDGEQVKVVEVPAVEAMASVVHYGCFNTLHRAYHTLLITVSLERQPIWKIGHATFP